MGFQQKTKTFFFSPVLVRINSYPTTAINMVVNREEDATKKQKFEEFVLKMHNQLFTSSEQQPYHWPSWPLWYLKVEKKQKVYHELYLFYLLYLDIYFFMKTLSFRLQSSYQYQPKYCSNIRKIESGDWKISTLSGMDLQYYLERSER